MTDTPTDSPLFVLIERLVAEDSARKEQLQEVMSLLTAVRNGQTRAEVTQREIRNELLRQDQQIQTFDRRISGNYMGIGAQFDVVSEELRETRTALGNVERAVVELSRDTKTLHGRFIEENRRRGNVELEISALGERLAAVERASGTEIVRAGGEG